MKFIDANDLTAEHFKTLTDPRELTPDQKAEVMRLYMSEITEADLQQYADWENATPFEDFLRELQEEQRQWDERHP